ncbi:MAG: hypothetical protein ACK56I_12570, partial [bacterium]
ALTEPGRLWVTSAAFQHPCRGYSNHRLRAGDPAGHLRGIPREQSSGRLHRRHSPVGNLRRLLAEFLAASGAA